MNEKTTLEALQRRVEDAHLLLARTQPGDTFVRSAVALLLDALEILSGEHIPVPEGLAPAIRQIEEDRSVQDRT